MSRNNNSVEVEEYATMGSKLFAQMNFLIVIESPLEIQNSSDIISLLKKHSAANCDIYRLYDEDENTIYDNCKFLQKFGEKNYHQVISNTCNFPFYKIILHQYLVPVSSYEWVNSSIESNSIQRASKFSPNPNHFFRNYQIYLSESNINKNDVRVLSEIIILLGGHVADVLSSKVTHIISDTPNDPAIHAILNFKPDLDIKFVYLTWIIECFISNMLVDESQHLIQIEGDLDSKIRIKNLWEYTNSISFDKDTQNFKDKSFILGNDLTQKNELRYFVERVLINHGAKIEDVNNENKIVNTNNIYYLGYSQKGQSNDNIIFDHSGNISWLFQMLGLENFTKSGSNLTNQLLPQPLFDENEMVLTYTTIYGPQRNYVKKLVLSIGGRSTPTLSKQNTHLVFGLPTGNKYSCAFSKFNNIKIVNVRWLEQLLRDNKKIPEELYSSTSDHLCFNSSPFIGITQKKDIEKINEEIDIVTDKSASSSILNNDVGDLSQLTEHNENVVIDVESQNSITNSVEEDSSLQITQVSKIGKAESHHLIDTPEKIHNPTFETKDIASEKNASYPDEGKTDPVSEQLLTNTDKPHELPVIEKEQVSMSCSDNFSTPTASEPLVANADTTFGNELELRNISRNKVVVEDEFHSNTKAEEIKYDSQTTKLDVEIGNNNEIPKSQCKLLPNSYDPLDSTISPLTQLSSKTSPVKDAINSQIEIPVEDLNNKKTELEHEERPRKRNVSQRNISTDSEAPTKRHLSRRSKDTLTNSSVNKTVSLSEKATKILMEALDQETYESLQTSFVGNGVHEKPIYEIRAVCTGCLENITSLDVELLSFLGVHIYEKIDEKFNLNAIIAPKRMRTAKFLKSYSFKPLSYLLLPDFITDLLEKMHSKTGLARKEMELDPYSYCIPEINVKEIIEKSSLDTKVFVRAKIRSINLVSDIPGGTEVISSILKAHGIINVNILSKHFSVDDLLENQQETESDTKPETSQENLLQNNISDYIIIANKASQVKRFKKHLNHINSNFKNKLKTALAVEWNWCVKCIFDLEVDLASNESVIFSMCT